MEVKPGYKQTEVGVIPEDWDAKSIHDFAVIKTGPFGTLLKAAEYSGSNGVPLISVGEIRSGFLKISEHTPRVPENVVRKLPQYVVRKGDIVFGRKGGVERSALIRDEEDGWFLGSDSISIRPSKQNHAEYLALQFQNHQVQNWLTQNAIGTTMASLNQEILKKVTIPLPPTISEQSAIATVLSDVDSLIESLSQLIAKKRQIKQGAMKQLLTGKTRLPGFEQKAGYKQTEVGVIPEDWEVKQLGEVIEKFVGGGTPSRSIPDYWGNEIPWVTVKDFETFHPRHSQEAITRAGLQNSASHLIPKRTLITSTRMALGKAVVYEIDVAINQDLKALFPKPVLATQYLYCWFQYYGQSIDELGSGSTVKGISLPDLKNIEFQLPPIAEQTAIATALSDMDAEIAALESRRDKTRLLKQGMMQELLTGRIRLVNLGKMMT